MQAYDHSAEEQWVNSIKSVAWCQRARIMANTEKASGWIECATRTELVSKTCRAAGFYQQGDPWERSQLAKHNHIGIYIYIHVYIHMYLYTAAVQWFSLYFPGAFSSLSARCRAFRWDAVGDPQKAVLLILPGARLRERERARGYKGAVRVGELSLSVFHNLRCVFKRIPCVEYMYNLCVEGGN